MRTKKEIKSAIINAGMRVVAEIAQQLDQGEPEFDDTQALQLLDNAMDATQVSEEFKTSLRNEVVKQFNRDVEAKARQDAAEAKRAERAARRASDEDPGIGRREEG